MQLKLLGGVAIRNGSDWYPVRSNNARVCLALLGMEAGRPVPKSVLEYELWGDDPPKAADNALQATIARIRRLIRECCGGKGLIVTVPGGYRLELAPGAVDALAFKAAGNRVFGSSGASVTECYEALTHWYGPPLMGTAGFARCDAYARDLEQLRLDVCERLVLRQLADGHTTSADHNTAELVLERPLNERYCELRMLALYRRGCHAEALEHFGRFTSVLGEKMGMVPGKRLHAVYEIILNDSGRGAAFDVLKV